MSLHEFKATLVYIVSCRSARLHNEALSLKNKTKLVLLINMVCICVYDPCVS